MPSTNKTPFLGLSNFEGTDKLISADYNRDMDKLDDFAEQTNTALDSVNENKASIESGTWTPTSSQVMLSDTTAIWCKTGNMVFISLDALLKKGSSTEPIRINGLPFMVKKSACGAMGGFNPGATVMPSILAVSNYLLLTKVTGDFRNSDITSDANGRIYLSVIYETEV